MSLINSGATEHPRVGGEDEVSTLSTTWRHGTPPRRREGQTRPVLRSRAERDTPASAGRTAGWRRGRHRGSEHPRVGGEDTSNDVQDLRADGTLPRRRGGPRVESGSATAGGTPRVGGEDQCLQPDSPIHSGTRPRRRAGPEPGLPGAVARRNTLASAGRTPPRGSRTPSRPEHPRVGGEDDVTHKQEEIAGGTPPRRRGGPARAGRVELDRRNTPASAGRTPGSVTCPAARSEHPRVGREDWLSSGLASRLAGTPPRRRGGRLEIAVGADVERNTPASAERTGPVRCRPSRWPEHPRVGGEELRTTTGSLPKIGAPPRRRGGRVHSAVQRGRRRNTPASAGRTCAKTPRWTRTSEHPRVGGEDTGLTSRPRMADGTPPRWLCSREWAALLRRFGRRLAVAAWPECSRVSTAPGPLGRRSRLTKGAWLARARSRAGARGAGLRVHLPPGSERPRVGEDATAMPITR